MSLHEGRIRMRTWGALLVVGTLLGGIAIPAVQAATPAPTITSFSPTAGPVGTEVTIIGTNFVDVTGVRFKNTAAAFTVDSSTHVRATVPTGAMSGPISVTTPAGTATSSTWFTVTAPGAPTITSFSPTSGPVGTEVTITGTNFTGATSVKFKNKWATFTVDSSTRITATVPSRAMSGPISVTTPDGTATSSEWFTVTVPGAPTITSFSPTSGPVGTVVTITGTNFTGATSVKFKRTSASFTVDSSTRIRATVPSGATTGPISVTTPDGTATSSADFTVTTLAPTITSFSPISGPIGTLVTIIGTNFVNVTGVKFDGTPASFTVNSSTRITAKVLAGSTTGPISVTTLKGTATSPKDFTVTPVIHDRSVSLNLRRHLVARGQVSAPDGTAACYQAVTVKVQRRVSGLWRTVEKTVTGTDGIYRTRLPDRIGKYRARAPRFALANGEVCGRATSPVAFHFH